jgi:hypothetical protein
MFLDSVHGKEGAPVSRAYDLSAGFAGRIGVMTAEGIGFAIGPDPFLVLIALVGRDAYHRTNGRRTANSF